MNPLKFIFSALVPLVFIFSACQSEEVQEERKLASDEQIESVTTVYSEQSEILEEDATETEELMETTITIGSIGDILLHERAYVLAETEDGYDFTPMLDEVGDLIKAPDFMMANQESIPGGVEIGLSTYPSFNSPQEIVRDLHYYGVDMFIGANNHTLDRGMKAVESALDYYDELGVDYVGIYRDTEDRNKDRIVEVEGITIGVLAYTYGTNGIPLPENNPDVVALIEEEQMKKEIESLRSSVDVLVVHMHWGDEYAREPNDEQIRLSNMLSEQGVDVIFGHHPHVIQPIEIIEQEKHKTVVFYSLGNFYSGQEYDFTDLGGVATIDIIKNQMGEEEEITLDNPLIEPTLVLRSENNYQVVPFTQTEYTPISGSTLEEIQSHIELYLMNSN
ncbi:capsular polysaccharide biosynthesis protein [Bacillus sp. TS-2]|nr:capsular polysaccharide biosynthesis protein [Bacillus sp. TS-2]